MGSLNCIFMHYCRPKQLKVGLLRIRLLTQLASFPSSAQFLEPEEVKATAKALLAVLSQEGCLPALAHEAAQGISILAGPLPPFLSRHHHCLAIE